MNKYFLLCTQSKFTYSFVSMCAYQNICVYLFTYTIFYRLSGYNSQAVSLYTLVTFLFILHFKSIPFFIFPFCFSFSVKTGFHILAQAGFELTV